MQTVTLGKTSITVNKNGFGALPVQRVPKHEAVALLNKAFDNGITFFDTARVYSDSEEKLGLAFGKYAQKPYYATKTAAQTADGFWKDLDTSLRLLQTDVIDIYQFHNPAFCPVPGDESGLYDAAMEARRQGKIRFIGLTNHRLSVATEAVQSGLYDTLQFPLCYLSTEKDVAVAELCREANMGFLAMKALSGGLITNAAAAYAYLAQFAHVLPIWGVQRETELDEFIRFMNSPPVMTDEISKIIKRDRQMLAGSFCRGCGYCLPCPAGIEINNCARMSLLLRRSPSAQWLEPAWQEKMAKIDTCVHCDHCKAHCPYSLDTPSLLLENLRDYRDVLNGKKK